MHTLLSHPSQTERRNTSVTRSEIQTLPVPKLQSLPVTKKQHGRCKSPGKTQAGQTRHDGPRHEDMSKITTPFAWRESAPTCGWPSLGNRSFLLPGRRLGLGVLHTHAGQQRRMSTTGKRREQMAALRRQEAGARKGGQHAGYLVGFLGLRRLLHRSSLDLSMARVSFTPALAASRAGRPARLTFSAAPLSFLGAFLLVTPVGPAPFASALAGAAFFLVAVLGLAVRLMAGAVSTTVKTRGLELPVCERVERVPSRAIFARCA